MLSAEEVERRVDVRGGGAPRAPIERPVRHAQPPRRRDRSIARDSLLLIGLVVIGLVAVSFLLPDGPLTTRATSTPGSSEVAIASATPRPTTPGATNGGSASAVAVVATLDVSAGPTLGPTVAPPTPTLAPGATPRPTQKPGATPTPTPKPTPTAGPTAPPPAELIVEVITINQDGGTATSSNWTMSVTSAGTASPSSFPGVSFGTVVAVSPGKTYSVSASGPSGYTKTFSADCSSATGGLPVSGAIETCTLTLNDQQPRITVYTIVDGGPQTPADWTVTVTGSHVNPSATFPGSSDGTDVRFDANAAFTITQANPNDTDYTAGHSGTCSGSGLGVGVTATCTYTFTYVPPPTTAPSAFLLPLFPGSILLSLRRRWRPIHRT